MILPAKVLSLSQGWLCFVIPIIGWIIFYSVVYSYSPHFLPDQDKMLNGQKLAEINNLLIEIAKKECDPLTSMARLRQNGIAVSSEEFKSLESQSAAIIQEYNSVKATYDELAGRLFRNKASLPEGYRRSAISIYDMRRVVCRSY